MKHKIILEIKKVAAEIEQSNSFNTKHYKELLSDLYDRLVVLDYLEDNIKSLVETKDDQIEFGNIADDNEEELVEEVPALEVEPEEIVEESKIEAVEDESAEKLKRLREFEENLESVGEREVKKSLHDELKKNSINIGLNDRIAFVKVLFDGNQQDFNRVLSQVNSYNTLDEVRDFIDNYVRPDHNWEDHLEYSERFVGIIESKFE